MSNSREESAGFSTQLDLSQLDVMTPEESAALLNWYETSHSDGEGQLTPFVPFLIENDSASLKIYRAYVQSLDELGKIPQAIIAMLFLHYYMIIGNESGTHYEVIASLQWGATKREVLDLIGYTFVKSGPFGANTASVSQKYLSSWPANEPRRIQFSWPDHWTPAEKNNVKKTADTPTSRLLSHRAPQMLAALEARRNLVQKNNNLPPAFLALCELHSSVARGRIDESANAARLALESGATQEELIEVIGFAALYVTTYQLDEIANVIEPMLSK